MRKVIAAMNMTLDGYCDHTAMNADDQIHEHYNEVLRNSGVALYGRKTFELMEYWKSVVENPTGNKATDDFAITMDNLPKIVFSHTLKDVDWKSARLAKKDLEQEVTDLKQDPGKDILVGSPGLIAQLTQLGMVDEYQLSVHPTVVGTGLQLFKDIKDRVDLKLLRTETFDSGAIALYYEPTNDR